MRRPHLHSGATAWLLIVVLGLLSVSSEATAHQSNTDAITATATTGTVMLQPSGSVDAIQLGTDAQSAGWGAVLQVGDDGEAALADGSALSVRVFHGSQSRVLGPVQPDTDATASSDGTAGLPPGGQPAYELVYGTTYNTAAADPDSSSPVVVATPGATVSSISGTFLLYYDQSATTTWVIVTDGTATITSTAGTIDVPAAFVTSVVDGAQPNDPQPANRSTVGTGLPSVDTLTNGALADADILAAAPPPVTVDASAGQAATPPDTAFAAGASDTALQPALSDLGGLVPFPSTATLRAGRSTVWYWPQRQGDLDTVSQDDTRTVTAGDGVNVSDVGRAELSFADFNVQLYRHAQLQMIPTADPNGYGRGYDLVQGAALNTISANALQTLSNTRVGVRAGWAVVTAVYTAHPIASTELVAQSAGRLGQAPGDTPFLVASDGSSTWVVVTQGSAQVEPVAATSGSIPAAAAPAIPVVVSAGSQTWVDPGQPPVPPVPATRAAVGNKFPTFEDLTNGELSDAQVLAGSSVTPIQISAPVTITPPSSGQNRAACYRFTSTPIGGKAYALTMRFGSLPAPAVTYWNPPANTWFTRNM
jgi:hypothetical protein